VSENEEQKNLPFSVMTKNTSPFPKPRPGDPVPMRSPFRKSVEAAAPEAGNAPAPAEMKGKRGKGTTLVVEPLSSLREVEDPLSES